MYIYYVYRKVKRNFLSGKDHNSIMAEKISLNVFNKEKR